MNSNNVTKIIILIHLGVLAIMLFFSFPPPADRILNIQNYLITASGIISGIVIAYLSAKLFNIKGERESRQLEINLLSDKLTNYRRILFCVMKSYKFWVKYDDIKKIKQKYPGLNFGRIHNLEEKDELRTKFWLEDDELSKTTFDLYSAMEALYGEINDYEVEWIYERIISFDYTINDLNKFYMPSNQIWYYLEGRYAKHTHGLINDQSLSNLYKTEVRDWFTQIDNKFRDQDFDRHILAELSTDFHELYIPRLIELTRKNNERLPSQIKNTFVNLVAIFLFGVIAPLFIQTMNIIDKWNISLTIIVVTIIILSFVNFLFDFYKLMTIEIKPHK